MKDSAAYQSDWLDTAIQIRSFHSSKLKENENWRVEDTAKLINRSIGSVSQYLMIASWMRTHENQLRRLDTMKEAVAFCKQAKRRLEIE